MFFHGIDLKFLKKQYPFLNPDANVSSKNQTQLQDRKHLVKKFGLEPVHMLESSKQYPVNKCIQECFTFGEIVFAFRKLAEPFYQLSIHEIGIPFLDVRKCSYIFVDSSYLKDKLCAMRFHQPIFLCKMKGEWGE